MKQYKHKILFGGKRGGRLTGVFTQFFSKQQNLGPYMYIVNEMR
jgi:hypothetical protein